MTIPFNNNRDKTFDSSVFVSRSIASDSSECESTVTVAPVDDYNANQVKEERISHFHREISYDGRTKSLLYSYRNREASYSMFSRVPRECPGNRVRLSVVSGRWKTSRLVLLPFLPWNPSVRPHLVGTLDSAHYGSMFLSSRRTSLRPAIVRSSRPPFLSFTSLLFRFFSFERQIKHRLRLACDR